MADADRWADRFIEAALEPHLWRDVLGEMADATGSAHGQLIGFGPGAAAFNWVSGVDEAMLVSAGAMNLVTPDVNFRVAADRVGNGAPIVHEAHYDDVRDTLRGDDYLDLCSDLDIPHGCQTRLLVDKGSMIGLALLRGERDGRSSIEQRDLFARLAAHAGAAVRMQRAIELQGFALLAGTFEAMDKACWLVDGSGRVGGMTPAADRLLADTRLTLKDGRLGTMRADEARRIARALYTVLTPPAQLPDPVPLPDDEGGVAILLEIFPLPRRAWDLPFAPRAIITARLGTPTDRQARALIGTFHLTRAEADIALRIASGATRPAIAAARGVSTETLKAQIRSLYEKTGCNRESQLVRIVTLLGG
ncbi:helix-turn-helix transcriptional regulator [Sphingobium aromaticiconvertens]|uniref:helix-turn-helix transcriptional regulator n=1 Tax=Sphingobium aromaticiconvertens TaxID=365341 RepID=UPI0030192E2A